MSSKVYYINEIPTGQAIDEETMAIVQMRIDKLLEQKKWRLMAEEMDAVAKPLIFGEKTLPAYRGGYLLGRLVQLPEHLIPEQPESRGPTERYERYPYFLCGKWIYPKLE